MSFTNTRRGPVKAAGPVIFTEKRRHVFGRNFFQQQMHIIKPPWKLFNRRGTQTFYERVVWGAWGIEVEILLTSVSPRDVHIPSSFQNFTFFHLLHSVVHGNSLHVLLIDLALQTLTFRKAWNLGFCFSHLVIVSLLISKKFTNGGYVFNKSFDWKKQLLGLCFTYYVSLYICSYALSHTKMLKGTLQ